MNYRLLVIFSLTASWMAFTSAEAVTIPAGTTILVQTKEPMTSHETIRKTIRSAVARDVVANGKVALRAGTPASVVVQNSLRNPGRPDELTLSLASVSVNGRNVAVHTTGGYKPHAHAPRTAHGAPVYVNDHTYNEGTVLRYKLAQPLEVPNK
jgi:hypothetical protein